MTDPAGQSETLGQTLAADLLDSLGSLLNWQPVYSGHSDPRFLPLLFWLTQQIRPELALTLGVGDGNGYFALCEAMQDLDQNARIFGIDQWLAQDSAALPAIPPTLAQHAQSHHAGMAKLICADPEMASEHFDHGNVDLLVCDLDLTPALLKQIQSAWIPLMSECSAIVLQRVAAPLSDELADQLAALRTQYLHLNIIEGDGILVLLSGSTPPLLLAALCDAHSSQSKRDQAVDMMRWLGATLVDRQGHAEVLRRVYALEAAAQADKSALADLRQREAVLETALDESIAREAANVAQLAAREAALTAAETQAKQLQEELGFLTEKLEENADFQSKHVAQLASRDAKIADLTQQSEAREEALTAAEAQVRRQHKELIFLTKKLEADSGRAKREVEKIKNSTSWRITAPIRLLKETMTPSKKNKRR